MNWYIKHQKNQGEKRKFDKLSYKESNVNQISEQHRDEDHFMPWTLFKRYGIMEGKSEKELEVEWQNLVESPNHECIFRRGQWLVAEWAGVKRAKIDEHSQRMESSRSTSVSSAEQLAALQQGGQILREQFASRIQPATQVLPLQPQVNASEADQPFSAPPADLVSQQINREAMATLRMLAQERETDAEDLLAANAAVAARVEAGEVVEADKTSSVSPTLELVKVTAHITVQTSKLETFMSGINDTMEEFREKIDTFFKDGLGETLNKALAELTTAKEDLVKAAKELKDYFQSQTLEVSKMTSVATMRGLRTATDKTAKEFSTGPQKKFLAVKNSFNRAMTSALKQMKIAQDSSSKRVKPPASLPPLHAVCRAYVDMNPEGHNKSTSLFEAKAGLRGAIVAPTNWESIELVKNLAKSKKAKKDLDNHLKVAKEGYQPILPDVPHIRKIIKELHKCFDASMFSKVVLPSADWADKVYAPAYVGAQEGAVCVLMPHMCCMEARILFSGEAIILGIPIGAGGHGPKDLRKKIYASTVDDIKVLVESGGFCIVHKADDGCLLFPSGFLWVQVNLTASWGLKWSLSSDEQDCIRVRDCIQKAIDAWPELCNPSTGYVQFLEYLKTVA